MEGAADVEGRALFEMCGDVLLGLQDWGRKYGNKGPKVRPNGWVSN